MKIVHAIDVLVIGGAQTLLFENYHAIAKLRPDIIQTVALLRSRSVDPKFVASYEIPFETPESLSDYKDADVILYYKLLYSDTRAYSRLKVPVIVINCTQTDRKDLAHVEPCKAIVSVSNYMRETLQAFGVRGRHEMIYPGVDVDRYAAIEAGERSDGGIVAGRINVLNQHKHSDSWLRWAASVELPTMMTLEYMGGGSLLASANATLAALDNARNEIKMLGSIEDFAVKVARIKSWDCFLYEINKDEGVSVAMLEAMACGVPAVISNHYGNKEIIERGINGYVCKNRDEMKRILCDVIDEPEELDGLKMSTAEHVAEHYSAEKMAASYLELIESII